jgi:Zn-dependent protease with chaperone function
MALRSPSLAVRAGLALALMVGFYLLALAIVLLLLAAAWMFSGHLNALTAKLIGFFVMGALVILWSILPRPDRFQPPGPALTAARHPRLFQAIDEVARATGQPMPREVYLVPEVQAWVTRRGGVMGLGSRPVMGLGLSLLRTLEVGELRAVLAHEFGHHHGGDTRLGPWVYKTRGALARTLDGLSGFSGTLQRPFAWYAEIFLRISQAISRRQELTADQLAARLYGADTLGSALHKIERAALAFPSYWSGDVDPVLSAGFAPPLAAGFQQYLTSSEVSASIDEWARVPRPLHPHDTHPPLAERLAAVADLPAGSHGAADVVPAIDLLQDLVGVERELLLPPGSTDSLRLIGWDEVGLLVWVPIWQGRVEPFQFLLAGVQVDALVRVTPALFQQIASRFSSDGAELPDAFRAQAAALVLGAALALVLHRRGCRVRAEPGVSVAFEGEGGALAPFDTIHDILLAKIEPETWRRTCAAFRIGDEVLAPGTSAEVRGDVPAVPMSRLLAALQSPAAPAGAPAEIQCWSCRHPLAVTEDTRGRKVRCPGCGASQKLPG